MHAAHLKEAEDLVEERRIAHQTLLDAQAVPLRLLIEDKEIILTKEGKGTLTEILIKHCRERIEEIDARLAELGVEI